MRHPRVAPYPAPLLGLSPGDCSLAGQVGSHCSTVRLIDPFALAPLVERFRDLACWDPLGIGEAEVEQTRHRPGTQGTLEIAPGTTVIFDPGDLLD
jgi:hypothetical protein